MIEGLLAAAERLGRQPHRLIRYLAESSYWLYLAHLPCVLVGHWLLRDWSALAGVKFLVVCVGVIGGLLGVYQIAVRHTWLGQLLNGPRPVIADAHR